MIKNETTWADLPEGIKYELLIKSGLIKQGKTTRKITRKDKIMMCENYLKENRVITK